MQLRHLRNALRCQCSYICGGVLLTQRTNIAFAEFSITHTFFTGTTVFRVDVDENAGQQGANGPSRVPRRRWVLSHVIQDAGIDALPSWNL